MCIFVIYIEFFPYCLFVSNSQVIGCEDRMRNDLYCVGWGVKLCSINPVQSWTFCCRLTIVVVHVCLQDWEMLVLQVLRYDICAITPHDFVDLLLSRLPISSQHVATIRQHTQTFIALCATGLSIYLLQYFFFKFFSPNVGLTLV